MKFADMNTFSTYVCSNFKYLPPHTRRCLRDAGARARGDDACFVSLAINLCGRAVTAVSDTSAYSINNGLFFAEIPSAQLANDL